MMDRCRCCVLVAGCAIIILAVVVGEPVNFKDPFIEDCKKKDKSTDCVKVWSAFEQAYVNRNPCKVLPEAYNQLMSVAPPQPKPDLMLFWSGTKEVAHLVAKGCYQTIEDTLLGSVLDKKVWCGKEGSKETFTSGPECPSSSDCENNPVTSFWSRASAEFAAVASGKVVVLLDGSRTKPFYHLSVFAKIELVGFKPDQVESLTVVLVTKEEFGDKCENTSLKELQEKLNPKIKYICKEVTESKLIKWTKERGKSCKPCW
ncbi:unnamed protein product [Gadus morhua 'NCC']